MANTIMKRIKVAALSLLTICCMGILLLLSSRTKNYVQYHHKTLPQPSPEISARETEERKEITRHIEQNLHNRKELKEFVNSYLNPRAREKMIGCLQELLTKYPTNAELHFQLGRTYMMNPATHLQAIEYFQKTLQLQPQYPDKVAIENWVYLLQENRPGG